LQLAEFSEGKGQLMIRFGKKLRRTIARYRGGPLDGALREIEFRRGVNDVRRHFVRFGTVVTYVGYFPSERAPLDMVFVRRSSVDDGRKE
jgi:hypothetical protein